MILCRTVASDASPLRRLIMARGDDRQQQAMFSILSPEARVPQDHPLRTIRMLVDEVLHDLSPTFDAIYAKVGRPSIPPEHLLRALLLQVLYTVRSERLLMEQLDYNLLFRWFVGLNMDEAVWDPSTYSKNRERFLAGGVADGFFAAVVEQARAQGLLSDEHFTVDGTLVEAWAGHKSFKRKAEDGPSAPPADDDPGNPSVDFHGEQRRNDTHQSSTDPQARLARKGPGKEARLSYAGQLLIDNRAGLAVGSTVTQASGRAEVEAALYSVPVAYVGLTVSVHECAEHYELCHQDRLVARHQKAARHMVVMAPEHYVGFLRVASRAALPAPP